MDGFDLTESGNSTVVEIVANESVTVFGSPLTIALMEVFAPAWLNPRGISSANVWRSHGWTVDSVPFRRPPTGGPVRRLASDHGFG